MEQKTVLITGATAGIGRFLALDLARRGHRVLATGRDEKALAALRAEAPSVETLGLDVTSAPSVEAARGRVDELTSGRGVDVLINNAGYGLPGAVEELRLDDLRAQLETNVIAVVAVTQAFLPRMRQRGSGRIIMMSSAAGRVTFPLFGAYHASKYALEALSDALRAELAPTGIRVVLVEPGPIKSEFAERTYALLEKARAAGSPYASAYEAALAYKRAKNAHAPGPECVARAVRHAIESGAPRARYAMPFSTRMLLRFFPFLPVALRDRLVRKRAGLG
jgi:short-subunit dehydrogenase